MTKKITFEEAKARFSDRDDIELVEYCGWSKKSKFWDKVLDEEWWAKPVKVYCFKSNSKKRAVLKRKETCLKKYGVENPFQSEEIKKKFKKTNLKKYGVENPFQNNQVKNKIKATCLKKYGKEYITQVEEIKNKSKNTCLKKYGVDNAFKSEEIKKKAQETNLKRYGYKSPLLNKEIKEKTKQTNLERYGVDHWSKLDSSKEFYNKQFKKVKFVDCDEYFIDWFNSLKEIKPTYSLMLNLFNRYKTKRKLNEFLELYKKGKTSLEFFTEELFKLKHFDKKPKELNKLYKPDFKLSDKIYLNTDGLYWHCVKSVGKHNHFNLRKDFEEAGLRIFQFWDNELYEKSDIVKSIVNNSLGRSEEKIWARKCQIKQVAHKEAKEFLECNHMMGPTTAKHVGLYHNDKLVSLMSYKQRGTVCKIERFCSTLNHSVVGAFSKLLNYIEKNRLNEGVNQIHNWVDLRYGTGSHLLNKGFVLEKETLGWRWTDFKTTYNRLKCKANMDHRGLTEKEHAQELGWEKIYDAGQRLYVKYLISCPKKENTLPKKIN